MIKHAQENGADDELSSMLAELLNEDYKTPAEVTKAIGQIE